MPPTASFPSGELESAVLEALWTLRHASVRAVHSEVGEPRGLAYTTIATVLDRLCEKELVERVRVGKAFVYTPAVSRDRIVKARAKGLLRKMLGGEPHSAIAALVQAVESIDPTLLDELARMVAARRRSRDGS